MAQEYTYKGTYTYIYTDQDSYEPLAQIFHNNKDGKQYLAYIHTDQIGIPREMTDQFGNLLWYGEYTAWGRLKKDGRVYQNAHQPFRLQNQYYDRETGLHYNLMRYYEPDTGRFISQDPIRLSGGKNFYQFASSTQNWVDPLGLCPKNKVININPKNLRWTQTTAGGRGRADAMRESMRKNGYQGEPIDVVEMSEGLVTLDHTRAAVALELGIDSIPVRVHGIDESLPSSMTGRFGDSTYFWI